MRRLRPVITAPIGSRILSWNSIIALTPIPLYLLLYCETGSGVSARARDCLALLLAARALQSVVKRSSNLRTVVVVVVIVCGGLQEHERPARGEPSE